MEITLLHPEIVPDAQLDDLGDAIMEAYRSMDVVLYSGHAGLDPTESGVAYHYYPRHAITAMELAELNLPAKYQLYIFHGCKTYSAYPDAVYTNYTKTPANLDVISAVNFGLMRMSTVTNTRFLEELLATAEVGRLLQIGIRVASRTGGLDVGRRQQGLGPVGPLPVGGVLV